MNRPGVQAQMTVNLLPGPVAVRAEVREAFAAVPVSHRGADFMGEMASLRRRLCHVANAARVSVLVGSGTLANDAVAAQLSLRAEKGIVIDTGEFGRRLVDHACRWGLDFVVHERPWGEAPDVEALDAMLDADDRVGWVWAVHCETSTGVLADLPALKALCRRRGVDLCLDAVSSLGTLPVDLDGVHLASGASNKGLASYPGLALVFADRPRDVSGRLPRYLDLGAYEAHGGVPYTHSSNLVRALAVALDRLDASEGAAAAIYAEKARCGAWLRDALEARGFGILAPRAIASPAVLSLLLPEGRSAVALGDALEREGIHLSYRSAYLRERNLIQICLMGETSEEGLAHLLARLDLA